MIEAGRIGATHPVYTLRTVHDGAARRSLGTAEQTQALGFRRLDLDGRAGQPPALDPRTVQDRPQDDGRRRSADAPTPDETRRRPSTPAWVPPAPDQAGRRHGDAGRAPTAEDRQSPARLDPHGPGVPLPPSGGQTAFLAGSLGIMAQLFGQTPERFAGALRDATRTDDGSSGDSPSDLRTRLGNAAYRTVNRVVGAATERLPGGDGVEYLFETPAYRTLIDETA
ncbi:hypothetical protein [Roseospira navarrensis]|uniref:Uncharacterized protein n=1 Tax=Roseospira navarrensis TaxID=140058 RepID=A0A7X2D620_9PROT|nr:hypothetical protein [Roseospira navarrensis]MQX37855.1 hypothetical protein [Roseospira navarrensis]